MKNSQKLKKTTKILIKIIRYYKSMHMKHMCSLAYIILLYYIHSKNRNTNMH